jgi:hypothetical protein
MVAGKMTGSAAYQGALDASFGLGWRRYRDKCDHNRTASKNFAHRLPLIVGTSEFQPSRRRVGSRRLAFQRSGLPKTR